MKKQLKGEGSLFWLKVSELSNHYVGEKMVE
jgi:hypothetical protein